MTIHHSPPQISLINDYVPHSLHLKFLADEYIHLSPPQKKIPFVTIHHSPPQISWINDYVPHSPHLKFLADEYIHHSPLQKKVFLKKRIP